MSYLMKFDISSHTSSVDTVIAGRDCKYVSSNYPIPDLS